LRYPSVCNTETPSVVWCLGEEYERNKKLITPGGNRLHIDIIEASECLKNWWDHGLLQQRDCAPEDPEPEDFEPRDDEDDDWEL